MLVLDDVYRCPNDLELTPVKLNRVLMVGSCLASAWPEFIKSSPKGCACDFILVNNSMKLPETLPAPIDEYDFEILQMPLRVLLPEVEYFRLGYIDEDPYKELFAKAKWRLSQFLSAMMQWNVSNSIVSFIFNFLVPQQNPMGRLLPRYDLRNFVYFVERLNEELASEIKKYKNAYLFDFDSLASTFGRRYFQDDAVFHLAHGGALSARDYELDRDRLEPPGRITQTYPLRIRQYISAGWAELITMYRSVLQADMVKLVVVDIDDTLWRGVAAENIEISADLIEGWPLGFVEALCYLRRRGILLGLVSKNDEEFITKVWGRIFGRKLTLDDFALRKINWRLKSQNMAEIIREANVLQNSVVFVDDNPAERADIQSAFPGIRVIGPNPYVWKRILLWSSELQLPVISEESAKRTSMVRAQLDREAFRESVSRERFLESLEVKLALFEVKTPEGRQYNRGLELINKTNQFNTTGERRTDRELSNLLANGTRMFVFEVRDRFTEYGLVGVVLVERNCIAQFVMSCRVVGMDIEMAALSEVAKRALSGSQSVEIAFTPTGRNHIASGFLESGVFEKRDKRWQGTVSELSRCPLHVEIEVSVPRGNG